MRIGFLGEARETERRVLREILGYAVEVEFDREFAAERGLAQAGTFAIWSEFVDEKTGLLVLSLEKWSDEKDGLAGEYVNVPTDYIKTIDVY